MKLITYLIALNLAGDAFAGIAKHPDTPKLTKHTKRQGILSLLAGKGSKFMGDPTATATLSSLSKLVGASTSSAGMVGSIWKGVVNRGYGSMWSSPMGATAARQMVPTKSKIAGAKRVKLRHGPYNVPAMSHKNLLGEEGMLNNYPDESVAKPCEGQCTILSMHADLEYTDGTPANIDSGLWLHHMVLLNAGPGRSDPTCENYDVSLPHIVAGKTSRTSERIFASGNERGTVDFAAWGNNDVGYRLKSTDKFAGLFELMNENMEDKVAYVTLTYDYVEGYPLKDDVKCIWLDVRQCGTSEYTPPSMRNSFTIDYSWTSTVNGEIVGTLGHLHDGGVDISVDLSGSRLCNDPAKYGTKSEYVQKSAMGHMAQGALTHISDISGCKAPNKSVRAGQTFNMRANYDFNKFKGMKHEDGDWDEVMAITLVYIKKSG